MQDEVDRLVAAWARERPDLDVRPLEVLSRVTRLARHLDRARSTAFDAHDLEVWEFDVLAALRRAGRPYVLSPGQLVAQTLVTSGTMTNRVDRLETRGLVSGCPTRPTAAASTSGSPRGARTGSTPRSPTCWPASTTCSRPCRPRSARRSPPCSVAWSRRSSPRR